MNFRMYIYAFLKLNTGRSFLQDEIKSLNLIKFDMCKRYLATCYKVIYFAIKLKSQ